ncbi:unnamed protein product [Durusdinium trenchii]|uniref:Ubiquitin-like domain-containing protein n=1 Tax=Durusdinium trenchii TaxID=1381693 RepID=A0ABP0MH16_9DINO
MKHMCKTGRSALHRAALKGEIDEVERLLEAGLDIEAEDNRRQTPLHLAVREGHLAVVDRLVAARAAVEARDDWRATPLNIAAENGHWEVVQRLIEARADLEAKGDFGQTPLHIATEGGHCEAAQRLIDARADLEAKDDNGETPLHHAANYGHWEVAQRLIEARADLEAKDNYGKTPWERANMNGEEKVMGVLRPVQVGLLSGRTVRCDPNPCLTVRELREEAQSKLGRGFQIQQLLTRSGQVLQDPLTLEDAGVTYGDFVTAIAPASVAGEAAREREGLSLCVDARPSTDLRVVELEEEEKPC